MSPPSGFVTCKEALERVLRLTRGLDFDGFVSKEATYFAVIYSLGIVGEAAKSVSADIRAASPDVDWSAISRLRDLLFHVYFGISNEIIWQIITESVPQTLAEVEKILSTEPRD